MERLRVFFTGVGGQGTLTATNLLAHTALKLGLEVTAGEIHGMAQRGGVVESSMLLGGFQSPKISHGEADVLLGFEPLETYRALPYLKKGGAVVSSTEPIPPVAVSMGKATYPDVDAVIAKVKECAGKSIFLPCRSLGLKAGALQAGNISLLGAVCKLGVLPFDEEALKDGIRSFLRPKLVDLNLKAVDLGVEAVQ